MLAFDHIAISAGTLAEGVEAAEGLVDRGREGALAERREVGAVDAVDVDPLDPPDVSVGHQAQRPARHVLAAVAVLLERHEHRLGRRHRHLAHDLDEVLEALLADLPVRFHGLPGIVAEGRSFDQSVTTVA